jgi:MFS family permease
MKRIETHHPRVPWSWVFWMCVPWAAAVYLEQVSGAALTFTMRRFIEDPVLISFLSSINIACNFLVGSVVSYLSDRVWTRWGRRRPFLIVARVITGICLLLVPLMPNIWSLAMVIVIYQFTNDVGTPFEPLYNEVIPPPQRGRAATIRNILQNLSAVFFSAVMLRQFDQQYQLSTWQFRGEHLIYWVGGAILLGVAALLAFGVRETPPPHGVPTERIRITRFFRDVFGERQAWMLYLLYVCPTLAGAGIGVMLPLLQTEQLGFSKAQIGIAGAVGTTVNVLVFFPLAGYLTDRVSRLWLFRLGVVMPVVINLGFWWYLRFVAHYQITLAQLIGFGLVSGFFLTWVWTVWGPLIYDYMPSNKFGTYSAGFGFVAGVTGFVLTNLCGLWVRTFTKLFGNPGPAPYDYSSAFLWSFALGLVACVVTFYFEREAKRGRVIAYGQIELKEERELENRVVAADTDRHDDSRAT